MNKAVQIKWIEAEAGTRALFQLTPPMETDRGVFDHVVVSALDVGGDPHTFIFPADADGEILSFSELSGTKGKQDHWAILQEAGYEPVPLVSGSSVVQ